MSQSEFAEILEALNLVAGQQRPPQPHYRADFTANEVEHLKRLVDLRRTLQCTADRLEGYLEAQGLPPAVFKYGTTLEEYLADPHLFDDDRDHDLYM